MKKQASLLERVPTEIMIISDRLKMVFVAFLWSLCYPLIKVGLSGGIPPLLFGTLRTAIAALVLFGVAYRRKEQISQAGRYKFFLFVIGLMAFFGYYGMFVGGSSVSPGLASVIGNSNPIMASLLAAAFLSESLNLIKIAGLFFGFIGVVLISVPTFFGETSNSLVGIGLVLIGALGTAAGNVFLKKFSKSSFPISVLAIQFMLCSVLLFSSALMSERPLVINWNLRFSVSLIILSVVGTAFADIIWLDLLKRNSLTKLNVFIFLTPAFSLVMGMIFFKEKLGVWEIIGIGAILIGVLLVIDRESDNTKTKDKAAK
jgi:drug/metabolite transporter (DMT)-like permease